MKLFFSPHNDDETLFGAFTLLRERPLVVVVYDGYAQASRGLAVTAEQRRAETRAAMDILGCEVEFLGLRDDMALDLDVVVNALRRFDSREAVYAPAFEIGGHPQHNAVAAAAEVVFDGVTHYGTYTTAGKSRLARVVPLAEASWVGKKLRALACYESQHSLDPRMGCVEHFLGDLVEYYS